MNRRNLIVSVLAMSVSPVGHAAAEPVADEMSADWQALIEKMRAINPLAGAAALRAYMMDIDVDTYTGIYRPFRGGDPARSPILYFGNWQSDEVYWMVTATNARRCLNLSLHTPGDA